MGEKVSVVAWMDTPGDRLILPKVKNDGSSAYASATSAYTVPLMTVAQHERIIAGLEGRAALAEGRLATAEAMLREANMTQEACARSAPSATMPSGP